MDPLNFQFSYVPSVAPLVLTIRMIQIPVSLTFYFTCAFIAWKHNVLSVKWQAANFEVFLIRMIYDLQEKLEEWSESISSLFCCLSANKKIVVATSAWWELTAVEKYLLSLMVAIHSNCTTIDIPVFLPVKSPKVWFHIRINSNNY